MRNNPMQSEWLINELRKIADCKNIKNYFFKNGEGDKAYKHWTISNGNDKIGIYVFEKEEHLFAVSNGKSVFHEYVEKANGKRKDGIDEKSFRDYLKARLRDKGIL